MKKHFFLIALLCGMISFSAGAQDNRDWGGLNRYAKDNAAMTAPEKGEKRVVFLGNSITEGWVNTHPDFFKDNKYIGRGISGQTSYQFLLRFREDVINLQPKLVVINAGTNDVAENTGKYNEDYTFGNIVSMVELAKANKIKVILTSTLPAAAFGWNPSITDAADKIASLNARIKAYAKEKGFTYDRQSEKVLKNLKEVAEFEGYLEGDSTWFKTLEAKLTPNLERDFDRFKKEVTRMLESEIVKRYYYQKGELLASLKDDKVLEKALEVLANRTLYQQTLSTPEGK